MTVDKMKTPRTVVTISVAIGLCAVMSQTAAASSGLAPTAGSPFTSVSEFISDIPNDGTFGPIGLLDDGSHFYVADYHNATMYMFPLSGGSANSPQASALNGINSGLAVARGVYYGAAQPPTTALAPGLYTFDPNTLAVASQVATFPGAFFVRQVVVDPLNAFHLYVSTDAGIFIVDTSVSPASVAAFGPPGNYDGMEFTRDGSRLYVAAAAGDDIFGFDRTGAQQLLVNLCCGTDGIAVAQPNTVLGNGVNVSNNIFVNMNDGTIQRIDVNNGNQVTTVASGGTRGDFITVGPDGTLYATQTDDVLKLEPAIFQVLDTAPPTIVIQSPAASATYSLNQAVAASYSCSDSDSGVATCLGTVANGSNIDTTSPGVKTFTVNASDNAGNQSSSGVSYTVDYAICALYDQTAVHQAGSTVAIKLELCDASGKDVSSSSIAVTAVGINQISTSASGTPVASGNANPDNNFRYDSTIDTTGGYIYNLSSKGMSTGTWSLSFSVTGDPTAHSVLLEIR